MLSPGRATILLVEDERGVARLEQLRLERAGHTVLTATSAEEALQHVSRGGIELIVLDQGLQAGVSGLEFLRQIKAAGHNVPAILVTGLQQESLLVEALRAGVRDFVPKTVHFLNHLEPVVTRVLQQVRTEHALAETRIVAREHEVRRWELEHEIAQRKRVENALREAEEYLRLMVESVTDFAIFTVDPDGRIARWNSGAARLFGYSEQEILGQDLARLFTPEDQAGGIPEQELATAAAKGRSSDERWHARKDGSRFFASGVLTPMFDEDNRLRGYIKIARDITERKAAEEAVRDAAVRLKAIVESAVDGIITIDDQGRVESMNHAAERIFGYQHEEVVGRNMAMLISEPANDGDAPANDLWVGLRTALGASREIQGRRKDGITFPMDLAVSETRLGLRRIFTGIIRDMTEPRKAAEERTRLVIELEAERALLNSLLDNAPVGFGFFDRELRYLRVNPALAEINGLPIEAHLGRTLSEILPSIAREVRGPLGKVLETGQSIVNMEVTGETPKRPGEKRSWLCNFYPVETADGTMLGAGAVVTDIDERKRMEEALKDADRRKDQFLAMLAHELRNPLAPISNAVQIMRVEGLRGPSLEWSIEVIEDQVKQLTRMVDDLLDVSRITRGTVDLQKELIELSEIIDLAVEASRPLIEGFKHHLSVTLPDHSVVLEVDPRRLAQVLSNLLNNAAKYTPEGGDIAVTATVSDDTVAIRVRDNGIGIAPDLLPKVFDLFVQADQALSRSRGGLGIGLTLVKSLVELHHGRVTAKSSEPGKGSEFTVELPVAAEARAASTGSGKSEDFDHWLPRRRILVVDDNLRNATSLEVLLRALGQEVHTAHDGLTAIEMARTLHPELVLLDIGLPVVDGYEVARRCRNEPGLKGMILVAITGYGKEEDRRRSRTAGFNAHLVKPVNMDDLRRLLNAHGAMSGL
jgi:PAS domain S-box-containing protein